jgi:divalent metal cation (Fe/Co/Zn/Cd) transporter
MSVRDTVDRVLAGNAGDYQRLDRVRSRRSGRVVFVEIVLSFEPGLTIAEVNRRIAALKQSMADEIEHADISILTTGATAA